MATLRLKAPDGVSHISLPAGNLYAVDGTFALEEGEVEEGQTSPERELLQAAAEQYQLGEIEEVKPKSKPAATAADSAAQEGK